MGVVCSASVGLMGTGGVGSGRHVSIVIGVRRGNLVAIQDIGACYSFGTSWSRRCLLRLQPNRKKCFALTWDVLSLQLTLESHLT